MLCRTASTGDDRAKKRKECPLPSYRPPATEIHIYSSAPLTPASTRSMTNPMARPCGANTGQSTCEPGVLGVDGRSEEAGKGSPFAHHNGDELDDDADVENLLSVVGELDDLHGGGLDLQRFEGRSLFRSQY